MLKFKFHSFVDVITNSSTTIYTYQNSVKQAKELVEEMLKLAGINDKTADDVFYYGVFCDNERYFEGKLDEEDFLEEHNIGNFPKNDADYGTDEHKDLMKKQDEWLLNIQLSIMKGEIKKPSWMKECETNDDYWNPDSYLTLLPKEEKYEAFGKKIKALLNSVSADGGRDG
jgi:hypothetical protein